jgi:hypothetical protein
MVRRVQQVKDSRGQVKNRNKKLTNALNLDDGLVPGCYSLAVPASLKKTTCQDEKT